MDIVKANPKWHKHEQIHILINDLINELILHMATLEIYNIHKEP